MFLSFGQTYAQDFDKEKSIIHSFLSITMDGVKTDEEKILMVQC